MKNLLFLVCSLLASSSAIVAQTPSITPTPPPAPSGMSWEDAQKSLKVYDANGKETTFAEMITQVSKSQVIFVGEQHDDPVAHAVETAVLKQLFEAEAIQDVRSKRAVALSMEMFERDTQVFVDEYLKGLTRERDFLAASRPWSNYATDYKPMIEFAKEKQLAFIAGNAPGRYVSMVGRGGMNALQPLSLAAKKWLAPLPYRASSAKYAEKFNKAMGDMGQHGNSFMLDAQTLRDATMAYSIAEYLKTNPKSLVVHVNGTFHSESGMGVPEHLAQYRRNVKMVVISVVSDASFPNFDATKHANLGDFVIVADASLPRSYKARF